MRRIAVLSVSALVVIAIQLGVSGQDSGSKPAVKPGAQPAPKASSPVPTKPGTVPPKEPAKTPPAKNPTPKTPAVEEPAKPATTDAASADEKAIRQTGETYVKAFNEANVKAIAEQFTPEGEYIDESGRLTQGRPAIEKLMAAFFAEYPGAQIELRIDSIRFIGPGIAVEDGMTSISRSKETEPVVTRYTAMHTKSAGKWLAASVRDFSVKSSRPHRNQLKQLEWMLGDWVHEGNDAVVNFSCKPVDKGNFYLRTFSIKIGGEDVMSGSQRIGWDASSHKFRTWTFDSDGGHSEGYWHRDGDSWVLKLAGVTADGHTASNTTIYSFVNAHTMTFQSVDHEVSGIELPDGPKVTIVRRAPQPE